MTKDWQILPIKHCTTSRENRAKAALHPQHEPAGCRRECCTPFTHSLLGTFTCTWAQHGQFWPLLFLSEAEHWSPWQLQLCKHNLNAEHENQWDQHSGLFRTISIPTHTLTLEHSFYFTKYSSINISFPYRPDLKTYLHFLKYWKDLMLNFHKCWITWGWK